MSTDIWELKDSSEAREAAENNDFKMVTFSLGGKDYGIDIMKVKEILKVNKFTYVPNSEKYVRGVYNLRGDIISIIDFRKMFGVPEKEETEEFEDIIVLNMDENRIGVIVDSINKVIALPSETIKEPHPIFSNINVKYIMGIVEKGSSIYLILDVERILGTESEEEESEDRRIEKSVQSDEYYGKITNNEVKEKTEKIEVKTSSKEIEDINKNFIIDTLKTFKNFNVTDINKSWFNRRFSEWIDYRNKAGENIQLSSEDDAELFISAYFSAYKDRIFSEEYAERIGAVLPEGRTGNLSVWSIGCGKGENTYSLTAVLKNRNPEAVIKVWANDKELISISNAPNLLVDGAAAPEYLKQYITDAKEGSSFSSELKDIIYFEYHDVKNHNPYPAVDVIFFRDLFSFYDYNEQIQILSDIFEKLKNGGVLIIGENEEIVFDGLVPDEANGIKYYKKLNMD